MGEAAQKDSSMEDILASIRKIITSDEPEKAKAPSSSGVGEASIEPKVSAGGNTPENQTPPTGISSSSPSIPTAPAGSLAALSAQMKSQTPSAPSKARTAHVSEALSSSIASTSSNSEEIASPLDTTSNPISDSLTVSTKTVDELATHDQTDHPSSFVETVDNVGELKGDIPSPYSGESLRELANRVASSPSQRPDTVEAAVVYDAAPEVPTEMTATAIVGSDKTPLPDAVEAIEVATASSDQKTPETIVMQEQEAFREALVAPATKSAVAGSMDRLRDAVESVETAKVEALLRPMLKEWLDDNLPSLVENLVQEEISRISSGK